MSVFVDTSAWYAALSAKGLTLTRDVMRLNETLAELKNNFDEYGEGRYWITVMGTPSETEPWGWQLDGHHLIINYFMLGDQVVMMPSFWGSEPVVARSFPFEQAPAAHEFIGERRNVGKVLLFPS